MKTSKVSSGRDSNSTASPAKRSDAGLACPDASNKGATQPTEQSARADGATSPPQSNWSRYADSRLRQFYCR